MAGGDAGFLLLSNILHRFRVGGMNSMQINFGKGYGWPVSFYLGEAGIMKPPQ